MVQRGSGSIFFTGAMAGMKGFANRQSLPWANSPAFAQALARELHPQNIHIGHFVIDGGIRQTGPNGRMTVATICLTPTPSPKAICVPQPAPQRLELGDRAVPLAGTVLGAKGVFLLRPIWLDPPSAHP